MVQNQQITALIVLLIYAHWYNFIDIKNWLIVTHKVERDKKTCSALSIHSKLSVTFGANKSLKQTYYLW